jgi:anti-sigma regulatory factor (Ser/Thr protein kinase)
MSTTKEQVLQYMLKLIAAKDGKLVAKTLDAFGGFVSKSTVYNYLSELCKKEIIKKNGSSYELVSNMHRFTYKNDGSLGEDRIFEKYIESILSDLPRNVFSAWRYAFTEMMNNAIEHSSADEIDVTVCRSVLKTSIVIADNGKGIFNNIQEYVKNERNEDLTLKECAALLFAGKFTTAQSMHSGEGIFFTSHLMDTFRIISDGVVFTRNNFDDTNFETSAKDSTTVIMELDNNSNKTTREVFNRFSDIDEGFIKTQIPIAHIFSGTGPVSRSEARRLGELIVKFKEVDLDFLNVEEVGQAFVHELFIVWQRNNPEIKLNVLNTCDDVDFMIKRVKNTK